MPTLTLEQAKAIAVRAGRPAHCAVEIRWYFENYPDRTFALYDRIVLNMTYDQISAKHGRKSRGKAWCFEQAFKLRDFLYPGHTYPLLRYEDPYGLPFDWVATFIKR